MPPRSKPTERATPSDGSARQIEWQVFGLDLGFTASQIALGFDAHDWALAHGVRPYHSEEHQFAGRSWCRLCCEERGDLVLRAASDKIFEGAAPPAPRSSSRAG